MHNMPAKLAGMSFLSQKSVCALPCCILQLSLVFFIVEFLIMFENSLFFTHETIELDHGRIKFGDTNITLVWKIISEYNNCNSSEVHTYPWCEPDNIQFVNITNKTLITLPSEISGMPPSISISSLPSDQPMMQCPGLPEILQFDCKLKCKAILHTIIIHLVILHKICSKSHRDCTTSPG